jgi:hypothetical protein
MSAQNQELQAVFLLLQTYWNRDYQVWSIRMLLLACHRRLLAGAIILL